MPVPGVVFLAPNLGQDLGVQQAGELSEAEQLDARVDVLRLHAAIPERMDGYDLPTASATSAAVTGDCNAISRRTTCWSADASSTAARTAEAVQPRHNTSSLAMVDNLSPSGPPARRFRAAGARRGHCALADTAIARGHPSHR